MQKNHAESIWSACSSNIWIQTDGWSRQAQAHEICKSVLFAQLQILFSNFIWHGVIWTIHSGVFSLVFSQTRLCRKQTKYITVLSTWTRNIASISAQPATIKGAAKTFLLSFRVIICVAHLWTQSSLDTGECNGSRTHFISITIRSIHQINIVRPEIKHHLGTCHFNQAFKFGRLEGNFNSILSEFHSILSDWFGPPQLHVFSWISHILIQLVQMTKQSLVGAVKSYHWWLGKDMLSKNFHATGHGVR